MSNESLKSAILAKCGELAPDKYVNYKFAGKTIKATFSKVTIYATWGKIELSKHVAEDDERWGIAAKILEIQEPPFPRYDRDFEQSIFDWADKNDDLGWATDGRHTFKSVSNN